MKKAISIATAALAAASVRALPALGHDHGHGQRRSYSAGEPGDPTKPSRTIEIEMSEMDYKPFKIEVKLGEQKRPRIEGPGLPPGRRSVAEDIQSGTHVAAQAAEFRTSRKSAAGP